MLKKRKKIAVGWLLLAMLFMGQASPAADLAWPAAEIVLAEKFIRSELYFGLNKPDGGKVSEEDWLKFLETEVTPRFPDGFTVLEGYGQFRDAGGRVVRESSRVLIIFYPKKSRAAVDPKIEELRANYKKQFNQESVLRLDFQKAVEVSF